MFCIEDLLRCFEGRAGGIVGPHCRLHAHDVQLAQCVLSSHGRMAKCFQMISFCDFFTQSIPSYESYESILKPKNNAIALCFVRDRGGKDPTDEVGAVELGLGNPCRWYRHRCSVEHPGAVMTSEVK